MQAKLEKLAQKDRQVPVLWLARYHNLITGTVFFYLDDNGRLECLWPQKN